MRKNVASSGSVLHVDIRDPQAQAGARLDQITAFAGTANPRHNLAVSPEHLRQDLMNLFTEESDDRQWVPSPDIVETCSFPCRQDAKAEKVFLA